MSRQISWDDVKVADSAPSPSSYDTKLSPSDETAFQSWKQQYAPKDSGADYDLRGAFKAGLKPDPQTGHWPDTFKKPNHPTFSNESQYAVGPNAAKAGSWAGPNHDQFVPPGHQQASWDDSTPPDTRTLAQRQADSKAAFEAASPKNVLAPDANTPWNILKGLGRTGANFAGTAAAALKGDVPSFAVNAGMGAANQAAKATTAPTASEALGHSVAAALPLVGPWAAGLGERAGSGDIAGAATELGATLAAPTAFETAKAKLGGIDPTSLQARANALRETMAKTPMSESLEVTKPLTALKTINRATMPIRASLLERTAAAIDAQHPAVQGSTEAPMQADYLGSWATEPEKPPIQGPSFPPPKEPALETVGAVRPPAEEITPGKLSVWDQLRKPAVAPSSTPESASLNKQLGLSARDVEHGADAGSQILYEKLLDPNKAITKLNVDAALKDSGGKLDGLLKTADEKGYQIDAQTPTYDAHALAQKTIGKSSDTAFDTKIQGIVDDMESRGADITKDTGHTLEKLSPSEAFKLKSNLGDSINWKTASDAYSAPENQMKIQIYRAINKQLKAIPSLGPEQFRWGNLKIGSDALWDSINDYKVGKGSLEFEPPK